MTGKGCKTRLTISGVYIPGEPMHTIQRDERYYERAAEFVPERWMTERAEMVKDKRALLARHGRMSRQGPGYDGAADGDFTSRPEL